MSSAWRKLKTSLAELGLTQSQVLFDAAHAVGVLFVLFVALFLAVSKVADVNQVAATVGIILLGLTKSSLKKHVDTDKLQSFKSIIKVVEKQALTQLKDAVEQFAEFAEKHLELNDPGTWAANFDKQVLENTKQTLRTSRVLKNCFERGIVRDALDWHKKKKSDEYSLGKVESDQALRNKMIREYISELETKSKPGDEYISELKTKSGELYRKESDLFGAKRKKREFDDDLKKVEQNAYLQDGELSKKRVDQYTAVLREAKRKIDGMVKKVKQKAQELEDSTRSVLQSSRAVASSVENHTTRKADEMRDDLKEMKQKLSDDLQVMKDEMKAMILASSRAASNPDDADETDEAD